jgi:D-amino-acid dehydrogenase
VRVIVIGGGVVGLCCAYELARAGAEVTLLEKNRVGRGASLGNTGWVCPSFSYPLPGPGVVREGLRGMLRGGGPLAIRPTLDPNFLRWLLGFRRSATRGRWERGVRALIGLNRRTLELFDAYADAGVEFEMHTSGLVLVATTKEGLASYSAIFRDLRALGFEGRSAELTAAEAKSLEPALSESRIAGGVHALVDRYVRPESLLAALAGSLAAQGVAVHEEAEVTGVETSNGGVRVTTAAEPLTADRVVVAAGASSPRFLQDLGIDLPLVGARGYSFTFAGGALRPSHALYLAEAKVGISSYSDSVRIAGVFELGHSSDELHSGRIEAMLKTVEPYFEKWSPSAEVPLLQWAGLRPMTADGLPLIGRAPALDNVFVATGHGMLGVTLAPATAGLLAPFVLEGVAAPELEPFDPARSA